LELKGKRKKLSDKPGNEIADPQPFFTVDRKKGLKTRKARGQEAEFWGGGAGGEGGAGVQNGGGGGGAGRAISMCLQEIQFGSWEIGNVRGEEEGSRLNTDESGRIKLRVEKVAGVRNTDHGGSGGVDKRKKDTMGEKHNTHRNLGGSRRELIHYLLLAPKLWTFEGGTKLHIE